jgi:chemotaxis protein MotB
MAEKKAIIVIKKITINGGGHHGGAWKVAFADFMTAMMAFFLCMWLLAQSDETKKAISDYFSTPSVIEYEFQNFGVEMTLEKMFNDILNEPLKAVSKLLEPMDKTPNVFEFGLDKVALSYITEKVGKEAVNIEVVRNELHFSIPDYILFKKGSANTSIDFIEVMEKVKQITMGLKDSEIQITSQLFLDGVLDSNQELATSIATQRLDLIKMKVQSSLEHDSTRTLGKVETRERKDKTQANPKVTGFIQFHIVPKDSSTPDAKKINIQKGSFDSSDNHKDLYDELNDSFRNEVRQIKKK